MKKIFNGCLVAIMLLVIIAVIVPKMCKKDEAVQEQAQTQEQAPKESGGNSVEYKGKTVRIGTQTWMAENLNYDIAGSKCYDNKPENCTKYGRLYDLATAKKACPSGWHLPNNAEWDKLIRYVDGVNGTQSPYASKTAGKYLKAKSGWNSCTAPIFKGITSNGTDAHGFSALPGGQANTKGFSGVGSTADWWSADLPFLRWVQNCIYSFDTSGYIEKDLQGFFVSIRCIKD